MAPALEILRNIQEGIPVSWPCCITGVRHFNSSHGRGDGFGVLFEHGDGQWLKYLVSSRNEAEKELAEIVSDKRKMPGVEHSRRTPQ